MFAPTGAETPANAMSFTIYQLCMNPECEEKASTGEDQKGLLMEKGGRGRGSLHGLHDLGLLCMNPDCEEKTSIKQERHTFTFFTSHTHSRTHLDLLAYTNT